MNTDRVAGRYRPLEVHTEPDVVVVRSELPEQTRAVLVSGNPNLELAKRVNYS